MPTKFSTLTRLLFVIISLVLLLATLAACNPAPSAPPPGTYNTTLVEADLPPELPQEIRDHLLGTWEIVLGSDQRFHVLKDGNVAIEGRYTSTQDQIVFTDEEGPASEPEVGPGTYEWRVDGKTLTLVPIDEKSMGRSLVAAAHPLTRQE